MQMVIQTIKWALSRDDWLVVGQHVFQDEFSGPLRWLKVFQSFLHLIRHLSRNCITDQPQTLNQLQHVAPHVRVCLIYHSTHTHVSHIKLWVKCHQCLHSSISCSSLAVVESSSVDKRWSYLQWWASPPLRTGTHHKRGTSDRRQNKAAGTTRNPETQTAL